VVSPGTVSLTVLLQEKDKQIARLERDVENLAQNLKTAQAMNTQLVQLIAGIQAHQTLLQGGWIPGEVPRGAVSGNTAPAAFLHFKAQDLPADLFSPGPDTESEGTSGEIAGIETPIPPARRKKGRGKKKLHKR
jgi:hypothetical protein